MSSERRAWQAPQGTGLPFSLLRRPPVSAAESLRWTQLAGVAVVCALQERLPGVWLKWPNDVLVGERKLGGILIEHRGEIGGGARVIVGIGLNLTMQTVDIDQPWTRLADHMDRLGSRNAVAGVVLGGVLRALDGFQSQGFEPFQARWPVFDVARDAPVRVIEGDGERVGIARGIGPDGALQVEIGGRTRPVYSGDVSLRLGA